MRPPQTAGPTRRRTACANAWSSYRWLANPVGRLADLAPSRGVTAPAAGLDGSHLMLFGDRCAAWRHYSSVWRDFCSLHGLARHPCGAAPSSRPSLGGRGSARLLSQIAWWRALVSKKGRGLARGGLTRGPEGTPQHRQWRKSPRRWFWSITGSSKVLDGHGHGPKQLKSSNLVSRALPVALAFGLIRCAIGVSRGPALDSKVGGKWAQKGPAMNGRPRQTVNPGAGCSCWSER
jgi:hypothetical protein